MKLFACSHCSARVFFENTRCEACGSALGYVAEEGAMVAFTCEAGGQWQRSGSDGPQQRPCQNYSANQVCNWMVPEGGALQCISCRTTHIIPALSKPENQHYWAALERAKRRLVYTLLELGLPVPSKADDAVGGLSFQFLEETAPGQRVLTGHDNGVITLNIVEADDAKREGIRLTMHEPYRTLLGHFRHESGHYYWDRLILNSPWLDAYRELFGDERADYAEALDRHYQTPQADWAQRHTSAYASSHPWEDWAECWAHYLHMADGLDTAAAWGLRLDHAVSAGPPLAAARLEPTAQAIGPSVVEQWLPVSQFVNAMNRSLGSPDGYPFIVVPSVIAKLEFIHRVVSGAAASQEISQPANVGVEPPAPAAGRPAKPGVIEPAVPVESLSRA